MKAIVRSEYGSPDVLELRDIDEPVAGDDDVLVRVHAAGVNMADVDYLLGRPDSARLITGLRGPRNRALGLDVAGQVEVVGKDVTRFRPGDEVIGDLTEHGYGGFAEYACAREEADSTGRRNDRHQHGGGCLVLEGLARPGIQPSGDDVRAGLTVDRQVALLREVLTQKPVGVLVRAPLPRAPRVAEVDGDLGDEAEAPVVRGIRLPTPHPSTRGFWAHCRMTSTQARVRFPGAMDSR